MARIYTPEFPTAAVQQVSEVGGAFGGGAIVGDVGEDVGELGAAGAEVGAAGQGVVPRAEERTGSGGDAIAAIGRETADDKESLTKAAAEAADGDAPGTGASSAPKPVRAASRMVVRGEGDRSADDGG